MGARFPSAARLLARPRGPRVASAVVAGDEIVAAALADLARTDGVRVARIWLLASFLGDEELDRRLKCALVLNLQATFQRFQAKRLDIWTDQDDDLARMILRRLGCRPVSEERRTGPNERMRRLRLVRSSSRDGSSVRAFSSAKASVTVPLNST